jgi:hypothetical protein
MRYEQKYDCRSRRGLDEFLTETRNGTPNSDVHRTKSDTQQQQGGWHAARQGYHSIVSRANHAETGHEHNLNGVRHGRRVRAPPAWLTEHAEGTTGVADRARRGDASAGRPRRRDDAQRGQGQGQAGRGEGGGARATRLRCEPVSPLRRRGVGLGFGNWTPTTKRSCIQPEPGDIRGSAPEASVASPTWHAASTRG